MTKRPVSPVVFYRRLSIENVLSVNALPYFFKSFFLYSRNVGAGYIELFCHFALR